jgi:hypothetical protein
MRLILPPNVFAKLIAETLPKSLFTEIIFRPSSLISKDLLSDTQAIGLIPSLDLLTNKTFNVASKAAISFDGPLSNSYLYFNENGGKLGNLNLRGDISLNEIILSKIIFEEHFSLTTEMILDTAEKSDFSKNLLIAGNENYENEIFIKGLSFSEEVSELIDLPYVNYIFASQDKESIQTLNNNMEDVDLKIEKLLQEKSNRIVDPKFTEHLLSNFNSVYFEFTENEKIALEELIKLTYFHRIIDDMFDVKFID